MLRGCVLVRVQEAPQLAGQVPDADAEFSKVTHGLELARETGLPFLVVVEWDDGIGYWKADRISGVQDGQAAWIAAIGRTLSQWWIFRLSYLRCCD
jgi:hypothetical protein